MDEDIEDRPELSDEEVADAFLKAQGLDGKEPKEGETEETVEEVSEEETTEEEASEEEEGSEEEGEEKPSVVADDDADVKVTVDGKELSVKVKDLKRLYGQEASLTQKGQSLAQASKAVETQAAFIANLLQARTEAAQAKVAKYADIDLFKANRELSPEDFDAIREAKSAAEAELTALTNETNAFVANAQTHRREILRDRARTALTEISKSIPEWNDELYTKLRVYAVSQGLDRDDVNEIVDPGAIIMMHKSMKYDAATAKTEQVKKKVVKSPAKVVKKSETGGDYDASKVKATIRNAKMTGDIDDIVDAYLSNSKSK